jgi:hypothetical protein
MPSSTPADLGKLPLTEIPVEPVAVARFGFLLVRVEDSRDEDVEVAVVVVVSEGGRARQPGAIAGKSGPAGNGLFGETSGAVIDPEEVPIRWVTDGEQVEVAVVVHIAPGAPRLPSTE